MDDVATAVEAGRRGAGSDLAAAALVAVACAAAAVAVGLVWAWVAPHMTYGIDAQYRLALYDAEPEQPIAADVWFGVLTGLLGIAAAIGVLLLAPRRPVASVGGLLLGTVLGAFVVLGVGALLRPGNLGAAVTAQPQATLEDALVLRAQGFLVAGPIAAMVTWTVLDLLRSALGREPAAADGALPAPDEPGETGPLAGDVPGREAPGDPSAGVPPGDRSAWLS